MEFEHFSRSFDTDFPRHPITLLAFLDIAYSMMKRLYETVSMFENTWIEFLTDLARYRWCVDNHDIVFRIAARFWYNKAAYNCPNVDRLHHHLAVLAHPGSWQQLALFAKSLTCVIPYRRAQRAAPKSISGSESVFTRLHEFLLIGKPYNNSNDDIQQRKVCLLNSYIDKITVGFMKEGVFAAVANIAALLDYGAEDSPLRLAFDRVESNVIISSARTSAISRASALTFATLSMALQRIDDPNVRPLIHVSFVFLSRLATVEKAMKYVEGDVPWREICSYLNDSANRTATTSMLWKEGFPKPSDDGRPLPEDFMLRGQVYSQGYFPEHWFAEAEADEQERLVERPSMTVSRRERILWLGTRIAAVCS